MRSKQHKSSEKQLLPLVNERRLWYNTFNASLLCVEPNIEEFFGNTETNEPDKTIVTLPLVEKDQSLFGKGTKKGTKKGTEIAERVELVFQLIKADPCITQMEIASKLSITLKQTKTALDNLKKNNRIKREGSARNGKWIII
ncbi:hypothetical protein RF007C_02520 [Ruminococcus flavefaciens 007c]|uniref:Winged helix-turn-helix transcriptional regulator n=1 Tax=Ruminococcus flavefaciens 007c TaxID=1341157 RepID=W7UZK9_RUMFL|nr:hypothetical protein RF007C_02520 [Ruminococcus flavefaciens 007c]